MAILVPPPRSSPGTDAWARWYTRELGWATTGTSPVRLLTGPRFDVLELPAAAGHAALRRVGRTGPVVVAAERMWLLVAAGTADELPGLLDWLEWGGIALDLSAVGVGGHIPAPAPPGGATGSPGAACWLRPPDRARRWNSRSLPSAASGAGVGILPISYDSWTRRRRNATGPGSCVPGKTCGPIGRQVSRWPSRKPHGSRRERGRGHSRCGRSRAPTDGSRPCPCCHR